MNLAKQQDTKKSKVFLYSNNEISQTETRKITPSDMATREIKYLGINLTKEIKDLYSENYTTVKKEIKKTQTNGSMYHAYELGQLT